MNLKGQQLITKIWVGPAVALLLVIDVTQGLRRRMDRATLRGVALLLAGVLGVMVLISLDSLVKITRNVQSLTGDSLIGLEAAVSLRGATREIQLELLRLRIETGRQLPLSDLAAYRRKAFRFLVEYQRGAFDEGDKIYTALMKTKLESLLTVLEQIAGGKEIMAESLRDADAAARNMTLVLDIAYRYNLGKTRQSVEEASASARAALEILKVLWWSIAVFAATLLLIYLSHRWLALPQDTDN